MANQSNQRNSVTRQSLQRALRGLPSVSALLGSRELQEAAQHISVNYLTKIAQDAVESVRARLREGEPIDDPEAASISAALVDVRALSEARLFEVINGAGVIVHTNLGRAPVSQETEVAMAVAARRYTPLELDIETGRRGGRMSEVSRLLRLLTGAEATLVVNNNAAAVLLVLSALCQGGEVVLARSQAVEIGGGFRIPDVLAQSGATLVEVGTTNRVYAADYERAISDATAALLMVHWSNFRIIGFTAQPAIAELASVSRQHEIPLIEDLGSGALISTAPFGLQHEPTVGESLADGVDIVCFSGDKLLGGPQAGIICGRADLVARVERHPLARAVRADKTALAGVATTLRHYVRGDALVEVPVWRMISMAVADVEQRCERWRDELVGIAELSVVPAQATVGGGSLPGETLESRALAIDTVTAKRIGVTLDELARRLRTGSPSVMPRLEADTLLIDGRTVLPDQDLALVRALRAALEPG